MFAGKKSAQIREILISESAWEEMTCLFAPSLKPFRRAADAIEASGLEYTILRPAWLTDEDIIDYELTSRNEPFKGTIVSRKSVAALITDIIDKPEKHIGENIGINQPGTDGDKPFFM